MMPVKRSARQGFLLLWIDIGAGDDIARHQPASQGSHVEPAGADGLWGGGMHPGSTHRILIGGEQDVTATARARPRRSQP